MAGLTGQNCSVSWIYSGGTVVLDTDQRNYSYTPSVDMYDQTAGADTWHTSITGAKNGQVAWAHVYQGGGSAVVQALEAGNAGTLIVGIEGTATGKPKNTIPAISQGAVVNVQYNNLIEVTCNFQQNGARVDGAF